jgi:hypothetical protein
MLAVIEQLVARAQAAGAVRADVSGVDVVLMVKGVCEAARCFQHIDPEIGMRQLDLVKSALTAQGHGAPPLRGRPPAAEDLDRAPECGPSATRVVELPRVDSGTG